MLEDRSMLLGVCLKTFCFVTHYFFCTLLMLWKYRLYNNLVYTRALAWCSGECPALVSHDVMNVISLKLVS
jgi:hypothetical protein